MKCRRWVLVVALGFLLGIQDGYIALWKDGSEKPVEVFPFQARLLPKSDQERLQSGIRVENSDELARMM